MRIKNVLTLTAALKWTTEFFHQHLDRT